MARPSIKTHSVFGLPTEQIFDCLPCASPMLPGETKTQSHSLRDFTLIPEPAPPHVLLSPLSAASVNSFRTTVIFSPRPTHIPTPA